LSSAPGGGDPPPSFAHETDASAATATMSILVSMSILMTFLRLEGDEVVEEGHEVLLRGCRISLEAVARGQRLATVLAFPRFSRP
jgi:hypothetical protein